MVHHEIRFSCTSTNLEDLDQTRWCGPDAAFSWRVQVRQISELLDVVFIMHAHNMLSTCQ